MDRCAPVRTVTARVCRGVGDRTRAPESITSGAFGAERKLVSKVAEGRFLDIALRVAIAAAVVRLIAGDQSEHDLRGRAATASATLTVASIRAQLMIGRPERCWCQRDLQRRGLGAGDRDGGRSGR